MNRGIIKMIHKKCRNNIYTSSKIQRFTVPDEKVSWEEDFPEYVPVIFTSKVLQGKPWADPDIAEESFKPKWNQLDGDGKINRVSFTCSYSTDKDNYPLNPYGRTGIKGRGLLGRWGPNHAADPIVTRWKRCENGSLCVNAVSNKPILQFVGIQRRDSGEWALPGGMVDPGEKISTTLRREFMEEAMNSLEKNSEDLVSAELNKFFDRGQEIFKGYVDDPRNTDNAWMETVACSFHDDTGKVVGSMKLQAGDDAKNVKWIDLSSDLVLYASHKDILAQIAEKYKSHW